MSIKRSGILTIASLLPNARAGRSVTYCALLGSSEKQWESANPPYRIFAPSFAKSTPHRVLNRTCSGGESGGTSRLSIKRSGIDFCDFVAERESGNYCTLLQETESNGKVRFPCIVSLPANFNRTFGSPYNVSMNNCSCLSVYMQKSVINTHILVLIVCVCQIFFTFARKNVKTQIC